MFFKSEQKKDESNLTQTEELTFPGKYYVPDTDIFESKNDLIVVMDMPGVKKEHIDIGLDKDVLTITGKVLVEGDENYTPVYSEYNIGNYHRQFTLSNKIDREGIRAEMTDGVLTLTLPKTQEAAPRRIEIQ